METFEDLIAQCLETGMEHHLLYVYMQITPAPPKEDLEALFPDADVADVSDISTILFDAHEPLREGLTFDEMRRNADGFCPDWNVVFVMPAANTSGKPITHEKANEFLADMRKKIMSGEFPHNGPIFDRDGRRKLIEKAEPLSVNPIGKRAN